MVKKIITLLAALSMSLSMSSFSYADFNYHDKIAYIFNNEPDENMKKMQIAAFEHGLDPKNEEYVGITEKEDIAPLIGPYGDAVAVPEDNNIYIKLDKASEDTVKVTENIIDDLMFFVDTTKERTESMDNMEKYDYLKKYINNVFYPDNNGADNIKDALNLRTGTPKIRSVLFHILAINSEIDDVLDCCNDMTTNTSYVDNKCIIMSF